MTPSNKNATVEETALNCIGTLILKGDATHHFIELKQLLEVYEKQIEKKRRQLRKTIVPTSFKASIENGDLEIFIAAEWIEAYSINEVTEQQVQECIE